MMQLSCGHFAHDECECNKREFVNHVELALSEYRGKWRETLEGYGIELPAPRKGGPCPICGGRDRFIFDDKDGLGTWHCRQCDPCAGGGLILLSRYLGKSTVETAKELIGDSVISTAPRRDFEVIDYEAARKREGEKAKLEAARIVRRGFTYRRHPYLLKRWLSNSVAVQNGQIIVPMYKDKELVNIQRISLDRKLFLKGGFTVGSYHPISGNDHIVALVEGYATGLTVNLLTGLKTFCAFSAANLPIICRLLRKHYGDKKIIIFADRDEDNIKNGWIGGAGMHYAEVAKNEVGAIICAPDEVGDWDDMRQKYGNEHCLTLMRNKAKQQG